jgi:hypothetical protein
MIFTRPLIAGYHRSCMLRCRAERLSGTSPHTPFGGNVGGSLLTNCECKTRSLTTRTDPPNPGPEDGKKWAGAA